MDITDKVLYLHFSENSITRRTVHHETTLRTNTLYIFQSKTILLTRIFRLYRTVFISFVLGQWFESRDVVHARDTRREMYMCTRIFASNRFFDPSLDVCVLRCNGLELFQSYVIINALFHLQNRCCISHILCSTRHRTFFQLIGFVFIMDQLLLH